MREAGEKLKDRGGTKTESVLSVIREEEYRRRGWDGDENVVAKRTKRVFRSDKERVGELAIEKGGESKEACAERREKEANASRKSGTSESQGVREYSAAQSNARLQAHETRGLSLFGPG